MRALWRRVLAAANVPGNWQNFPRVYSNKIELFRFLSAALVEWFDQEEKQFVVTDGEAEQANTARSELTRPK